jgi:hypothetical protein
LLTALVSGERLSAYASEARISLSTAKTHLRSLFDKTGERRQADLIRRALASPMLRRRRLARCRLAPTHRGNPSDRYVAARSSSALLEDVASRAEVEPTLEAGNKVLDPPATIICTLHQRFINSI